MKSRLASMNAAVNASASSPARNLSTQVKPELPFLAALIAYGMGAEQIDLAPRLPLSASAASTRHERGWFQPQNRR